ncbi:MAG: transcription termination factor Rho [Lachnospiraceae bacterium]|nr:transcription termination factor Rho [Lachnospiraceae bacterium]
MENQYEKMSLAELRGLAKEKGITGITSKKKQELIDLLGQMQKPGGAATQEVPGPILEEKSIQRTVPPIHEEKNTKKTVPSVHEEKNAQRTMSPGYEEKNAQRTVPSGYEEKNVQKAAAPAYKENRGAVPPREGAERGRNDRGGNYGGTGYGKENRQKGGYGRQGVTERPERGQNSQYPNQYGGTYAAEQRENVAANQAAQANAAYRSNQSLTQEELEQLNSGETKEGILEIMQEGFGFIRCDNFLPGSNDVYVSPMQIRKMNLKTGDVIVGNTKVRSQTEKFSPLLYVNTINGFPPAEALRRPKFEELTPIFPNRRIHLETPGCKPAMRIVDLVSPIGKGQRGMIVSQPKAGKTTLLKQVAHAITKNHPEMHMIILLIDERPEEVTDIKESIQSDSVEVIYSTFDELPENHKRVSEMVIERAKRLVEHGKDVIILLDSITRLARAYNLTVQSSGRTLSGGLDPAALHMPKKFFGAARNMREGGSLTILATALVETGSRMDDVVFEEFKGTGNMELVLDRNLSERRIFPAIDLPRSSTRREDLLLSQAEIEANILMRRAFNGMKQEEAVERIIQMFASTKNNTEFIETIKKTKFAY